MRLGLLPVTIDPHPPAIREVFTRAESDSMPLRERRRVRTNPKRGVTSMAEGAGDQVAILEASLVSTLTGGCYSHLNQPTSDTETLVSGTHSQMVD